LQPHPSPKAHPSKEHHFGHNPPRSTDQNNQELLLLHLAEFCTRYTPHIYFDSLSPSDTLFLDLTHVPHLINDEQAFIIHLIGECYRQGFHPVVIAITETASAGWAFTHFVSLERNHHLSQGWIIPPGKMRYWLHSLPVEAIRGKEEWHATCHELGCHTIGDVLRIPLSEWEERFGKDFGIRIQQLLGEREEILPPYHPLPKFEYSAYLEYPTALAEIIDGHISALLHTLTNDLLKKGQGALELVITFFCDDIKPLSITINLIHPTVNADKLYSLFQLHKEHLRLPGPITQISVAVTCAASLEWGQSTLFHPSATSPSREWTELLERLAARLGKERISEAFLEPDYAPEYVTRWRSCLDRERKQKSSSLSFSSLPGARPLRLLNNPAPIEVVMGIPSGHPYRFFYRGENKEIVRFWGPERIETGWWRGDTILRDYYRVETTAGEHFWIYRCLYTGKWFLHGIF